MNQHLIQKERDGSWLTIWMNRPDSRNALSADMISQLTSAFEDARSELSIRGITLRGRGAVFCSGGDLKMFKTVFQGDARRADVEAGSRKAGELFHLVNTMPQPVLALVEGAAMAGGLGMCCAADVVLTTGDARFSLTETTLGIPAAQIAPFVMKRTGVSRARRLMLTAARFDGHESLSLGIADYVAESVEELETLERQTRKQVLACAPGANRVTKSLIGLAEIQPQETYLDTAASAFTDCLLADEGREGVTAFVEKRKPRWADGGDF